VTAAVADPLLTPSRYAASKVSRGSEADGDLTGGESQAARSRVFATSSAVRPGWAFQRGRCSSPIMQATLRRVSLIGPGSMCAWDALDGERHELLGRPDRRLHGCVSVGELGAGGLGGT